MQIIELRDLLSRKGGSKRISRPEAERGGKEMASKKLLSHLNKLYRADLQASKAEVPLWSYDLMKFDPATCTFSA